MFTHIYKTQKSKPNMQPSYDSLHSFNQAAKSDPYPAVQHIQIMPGQHEHVTRS